MPDQPSASRTAVFTCLMRTLHSKYDRPALIDDTWADRLVLREERTGLIAAMFRQGRGDSVAGDDAKKGEAPSDNSALNNSENIDATLYAAWRNLSVYAGVIFRTRYAEDQVRAAAQRGVRQYLVIGAGLDSFGVRRPEFARDVQVFEIDHPASQQMKCDRLAASGVQIPPTLHFVPADLGREDLGTALARSAYQFDRQAVMSWLGVTVYLTREANFSTLRSIANFAAAGSELVFTYVEQRALDSDSPMMQRAKALALALGEPWICGFDSQKLPAELRELGLEMVEDIGGPELHARYLPPGSEGLSPGRAGRIARVRVTGR